MFSLLSLLSAAFLISVHSLDTAGPSARTLLQKEKGEVKKEKVRTFVHALNDRSSLP